MKQNNVNKKNKKMPSLFHQSKTILVQQFEKGRGSSKQLDKKRNKAENTNKYTIDKIYTSKTLKNYLNSIKKFCDFVNEHHPNVRTMKIAERYVPQYLKYLVRRYENGEISAYTVHSYAAAVIKVYKKRLSDYRVELPERQRKDIKRSRGTAKRDVNFNESKHQELVNFCTHTGLRRRELSLLKGSDLTLKDGLYYIHVQKGGKGGKERYVPILGQNEDVIRIMKEAGEHKVFTHINTNADIHHYRAMYAVALYKSLARPIEQITNENEIYICRKDLRGLKFDKLAMKATSEALGHSRIKVIANNYLIPELLNK